MSTSYFWPMAAQVALTFVVWLTMYRRRFAEMRRERIAPQAVAGSHARSELLRDTRASDNFANLFEIPVLFFAVCIFAETAGIDAPLLQLLAWLFVLLRSAHSLVQVTYNRVVHRFLLYVASSFVVFGMWAVAAFNVFRAGA